MITNVICTYEARRGRPPKLHTCAQHLKVRFKATFDFFVASALTVFEAGFTLKTQGSLVNGFMPFFAAKAAFSFNFKFNMPASLDFAAGYRKNSFNDTFHLLVLQAIPMA